MHPALDGGKTMSLKEKLIEKFAEQRMKLSQRRGAYGGNEGLMELAIGAIVAVFAAIILQQTISESLGNFSGAAALLLGIVVFVFVAVIVRNIVHHGKK